MLEFIQIQNFRSIEKLTIEGFRKLNVFIGQANTGKTSVLEAIYICLRENPDSLSALLKIRDMERREVGQFDGLFYNYDINRTIKLLSPKANVEIQYKDGADNPKEIREMDSYLEMNIGGKIVKLYGDHIWNIVRNRFFPKNSVDFISFIPSFREKTLENNLKIIVENREKRDKLPKICSDFSDNIVTIRFSGNKIMVEQKNLSRDISLKLMGNGFQSYIAIFASILAGAKYVVIDEIENGLHYEAMEILLRAMFEYEGVQFFFTTHNEELLQKLYKNTGNKKDNIAVFKLYNKNNALQVLRYSQDNFIVNMSEENELRD